MIRGALTSTVQVVVSSPQPVVLHVQILSPLGNMHMHISANAGRVAVLRSRALRNLEVGASETTDTSVHIPHARRRAGREVPLDQCCTCLGTLGRHNHIRPLNNAARARRGSDTDNRLGTGHVVEVAAARHDDSGERLAHDLSSSGKGESRRHLVRSGVKEHNLAAGSRRVDDVLQRRRIISRTVALCTCCADACKLGGIEVVVSRL